MTKAEAKKFWEKRNLQIKRSLLKPVPALTPQQLNRRNSYIKRFHIDGKLAPSVIGKFHVGQQLNIVFAGRETPSTILAFSKPPFKESYGKNHIPVVALIEQEIIPGHFGARNIPISEL